MPGTRFLGVPQSSFTAIALQWSFLSNSIKSTRLPATQSSQQISQERPIAAPTHANVQLTYVKSAACERVCSRDQRAVVLERFLHCGHKYAANSSMTLRSVRFAVIRVEQEWGEHDQSVSTMLTGMLTVSKQRGDFVQMQIFYRRIFCAP